MRQLAACSLFLLLLMGPPALGADRPNVERFARRWVYTHPGFDLRKSDETEQLIALLKRAKEAGYNGVSVPTGALEYLQLRQPDAYYQHIERVRIAAEEVGIELIPRVMRINGYSNGTLSNNPNLAPGLPVRDCVFEVRDGKANVANSANLLSGGGFEIFTTPHRPDGWDWVDLPGRVTFEDRVVKHTGTAAIHFEHFETATEHGNCRLFKKLQLKPWHQYHLRLWIKTEDVNRPESIHVMVQGDVDQKQRFNLQRRAIDVRATQDWTRHDAVFNTLDNSEVWLYIGGWTPGSGSIWIDDVSLHEVAGINLLRRDGCPIRVTSENGSQRYQEGRDFERWEYPMMGRVPYPGHFQIAHPEPPLVLTKGSRIRDGQKLKVSFYHTQMHMNAGVGVCLSNDELFQYLQQHCEVVKSLYRPKTYLMVQDEIRLAGWCECCHVSGGSTGQVLARCVRRCTEIIRRIDPDAEIVSWSDMFDPYHNAVDGYWLTRGTMKGSWEGLQADVLIGNWNQGHRKQSLDFFASRGHRQIIATYYDRGNWRQVVKDWLAAAEDVPNVDGIMYTTWSNDYRHLEEFIQLVTPQAAESDEHQ